MKSTTNWNRFRSAIRTQPRSGIVVTTSTLFPDGFARTLFKFCVGAGVDLLQGVARITADPGVPVRESVGQG